MRYTLEIPPVTIGKRIFHTRRLPPDLNARMHYMVRAGWSKAFREHAFLFARAAKIPAHDKAVVTIENHAIRLKDGDNLITTLKPILDGLRDAKVIPDDDHGHVRVASEQVRVHHKKDEKVFIHIEAYE